MDVSKNTGTPKMDVFPHGKPYEQMDDLGGGNTPLIFVVQHPHLSNSAGGWFILLEHYIWKKTTFGPQVPLKNEGF